MSGRNTHLARQIENSVCDLLSAHPTHTFSNTQVHLWEHGFIFMTQIEVDTLFLTRVDTISLWTR